MLRHSKDSRQHGDDSADGVEAGVQMRRCLISNVLCPSGRVGGTGQDSDIHVHVYRHRHRFIRARVQSIPGPRGELTGRIGHIHGVAIARGSPVGHPSERCLITALRALSADPFKHFHRTERG